MNKPCDPKSHHHKTPEPGPLSPADETDLCHAGNKSLDRATTALTSLPAATRSASIAVSVVPEILGGDKKLPA
jgi:hypothetical protein